MNRLKELRMQHGYKSQKELADLLYVNQTAISQWERDVTTPSNQMLLRLSELYQVSTDYLLGRTDDKETPTPEVGDGLNKEQKELVNLYKKAPPALQAAALAVLRSAEGQGKAPGGASEAE